MALGVNVGNRLAPASAGAPTDTGTAFFAGIADDGPVDEAVEIRSLSDFVSAGYGDRAVGNQRLYDSVDGYFREGGKRAFVSAYGSTGSDNLEDALAAFDVSLGPGQVMAVDETPSAVVDGILLDFAASTDRVALLDVENGASVAAMVTRGGLIPAQNADYGACFGPWVDIPSPSGVVGGSPRQIPASPIIAALCARVDALGNPNRAAAGRDFPLQYATGFVTDISMSDREDLLDAGVNTFATVYGVLENYGFQTAIEQDPDNPYWQFNVARARMWLTARSKRRAENYVFKTIDAQGKLARALQTDLDEECLALYSVDGLFGATPEEAFHVEVGASVNTVDNVAQGELNAVVEARFSPHAKAVFVSLVTIPITGAVTAPSA